MEGQNDDDECANENDGNEAKAKTNGTRQRSATQHSALAENISPTSNESVDGKGPRVDAGSGMVHGKWETLHLRIPNR